MSVKAHLSVHSVLWLSGVDSTTYINFMFPRKIKKSVIHIVLKTDEDFFPYYKLFLELHIDI